MFNRKSSRIRETIICNSKSNFDVCILLFNQFISVLAPCSSGISCLKWNLRMKNGSDFQVDTMNLLEKTGIINYTLLYVITCCCCCCCHLGLLLNTTNITNTRKHAQKLQQKRWLAQRSHQPKLRKVLYQPVLPVGVRVIQCNSVSSAVRACVHACVCTFV